VGAVTTVAAAADVAITVAAVVVVAVAIATKRPVRISQVGFG
jgi:hypothetical protein